MRIAEQRQKNTECRRRNREIERIRRDAALSIPASVDNSECLRMTLLHRAAAAHAKKIALRISEETGTKGEEYQRVFLQKLIEQPVLANVVPDYVSQRRQLQLSGVVCDGLAQAWSRLKYGIGRDRFLARNVIEAAVISIGDERCMRAAATCIGMNKRTIRRAIRRRSLLNDRTDGEAWAKIYRRKRKDTLEQSVVDRVIEWWTDETRVSPCKKDVMNKRVGFKTKISHATHWLEESQVSPHIDLIPLDSWLLDLCRAIFGEVVAVIACLRFGVPGFLGFGLCLASKKTKGLCPFSVELQC